jgi:hypothetical protein
MRQYIGNEANREIDYGHGAFGFVGRRWLDQSTFTSEHGLKFCRLEYFVDLDCLGGALEFASILFAFLFQPGMIAHQQGPPVIIFKRHTGQISSLTAPSSFSRLPWSELRWK